MPGSPRRRQKGRDMQIQVDAMKKAFEELLAHIERVNRAALDNDVDLQAARLQLDAERKKLGEAEEELARRQAAVKRREDALETVRELAATRQARIKTLETKVREVEQGYQEERAARLKVEDEIRKLKIIVPEILLARSREAAAPTAVSQ